MNTNALIGRLENSAEVIRVLVTGVDTDEGCWKPPSGAWSVVEIVNHLLDEEVEDFRRRLDLTLHHPETSWPAIDTEAAAVERRYNTRALAPSLASFLARRRESLDWLRGLDAPNWRTQHVHPKTGPIEAGDLLCSWVAHDYLHVRQITKRRYEYATVVSAPFKTAYAGVWRG